MKATPRQDPRMVDTKLGRVKILDYRDNETERSDNMYATVARIDFERLVINRKDYGEITYYLERIHPGREVYRTTPARWGEPLTTAAGKQVHEMLDELGPHYRDYVAPLDPGDVARDRLDKLERKLAEACYKLKDTPQATDEEIAEALRRVLARREAGETFHQIYFGR